MKRLSAVLAVMLCAVTALFADLPFRNHRYDVFKVLPVTSEQTVFIGNSITNMHEWWEAFADHNVVNRGVSGAITDEAIANIEAIAAGRPKQVFVMLGTNDLGTQGINTTERVLSQVKLIVERFEKTSPTTKIYIQSILPSTSGIRTLAILQDANAALKAYCEEKAITYVDLWEDLLDVASNANEMSYDKLHLTANAYKIWCDKIAPYINGTTSVYGSEAQVNGGVSGANGMKATVYSKLPVDGDDILMIGDEMINGGEWHELLRSDRVKNRGFAWGYPGPSLADMLKLITAIFNGSKTPAQVFLYAGVADVNSTNITVETAVASYKAVVAKIRELSPSTQITLMSLLPTATASTNTGRVVSFNSAIEAYAAETEGLEYLDIYTDLVTSANVADTNYFSGNYLYGKGYVKVAQKVAAKINELDADAAITAITDEEADEARTRFTNRTALSDLIVTASQMPEGDEVGMYSSEDLAAVKEQISNAYSALAESTVATDVFTTQINALSQAVTEARSSIIMPQLSADGNEVWYQLSTPLRGSKYLMNYEAGKSVTGQTANNYVSSMWKFVAREDGESLDIINRKTGAYLSPSASYNAQIMTSATQPEAGWTLSYAATGGYFIVSSGTVQLNQTLSEKVVNWSANQTGTDRADTGCQYLISLVEGEPDADPLVPTDDNFNNVVMSLDDLTDGWYKIRVVTGSTTAMNGYIEAGTNNVLNADTPLRQNATSFYPLKFGEYNTAAPATGWVHIKKAGSKYRIQSIDGLSIAEDCKAVRGVDTGYSTIAISYGGFATIDKWSDYQGYIGKASGTNHKYAFSPVSADELAAYDVYTVIIKIGNADEIGSDPSLTYNGTASMGGISSVFNNGYMFFPKGTVPSVADFTLPDSALQLIVDTSAKTLTVIDETLTLGTNEFKKASGASTWTYHGTTTSGGWYGKFVTSTIPSLTVESTDESANNMGYSQNRPWLKAGYTYNFTLPEGYVFKGYTLTTQSTSVNYTGTYTYTTADGVATSEAQAVNTNKTVTVTGLNTNQIQIVVSGTAGSSNYGILIPTMTITCGLAETEVETVPVAGKYYRFGYDFGSGVKYIQSVNSGHVGLAMSENKGVESVFYVEQSGETLLLKSYYTGKYLKETGNNRGLHNDGGAVTFTQGDAAGTIKIQAPSYLHAAQNNGIYYVDHCSGDGHSNHVFTFEEVSITTLTVNAPSRVKATATWNGETKTLPAVWSVIDNVITEPVMTVSTPAAYTFSGMTEDAASLGQSIEIASLDSNREISAAFALNVFSDAVGDKWVNISRAVNASHVANLAATEAGTIPTFNSLDYSNEGMIWCLVGNADSFKIYNKTTGEALALAQNETPANGVVVKMVEPSDATDWHLIEYDNGYAIAPVGNDSFGLNSYGGTLGNQIKFYAVADNGTHWNFTVIDTENPLTLAVTVSGNQPYACNYRVADMAFSINDLTVKSLISGNVDAKSYYLPVGALFSLSNEFVYRGYKFDGYYDGLSNDTECSDVVVPEGGLSITASYSVDADNDYQYLFYSNDPVMNKPYRIPAIAVTKSGAILAVTDHRPGGQDVGFAPVDIKLRRSTDNGANWSEEVFIADGTGQSVVVGEETYENVFNYAFGDAAIVADRESDEVLIMCVGGKQTFPYATATSHNYVARLRSHNGGETWDEPENVTANFMDVTPLFNNENPKNYEPILPDAYSMFYGSGRIMQSRVFKKEGSKYYRLYAALLVREVLDGATSATHNNHVVYSDDFGETWHTLGGACVLGGDEAKVEELADGTIIISSRKYSGRYFNIFTFTNIAEGEGSWGTAVASNTQTGGISYGANSCNGEIMKVSAIRKSDNTKCDIMLQSIPTGSGRENVAIYFKEIDPSITYTPATFAENWTKGLQVSDISSAYSTMDVQADGKIGFFYEEGPNAYCMVYVPLTIEQITDSEYSLSTSGTSTEIDEVMTSANQAGDNLIYDLQGRIVKNPSKGIYIINGKKVLVK